MRAAGIDMLRKKNGRRICGVRLPLSRPRREDAVGHPHQLKPVPADTLLSPDEKAPDSETLTFGRTRNW